MPYGQEIATVLPAEQQTPLQTYGQSFERMQRKKLLEEEKVKQAALQKKKDDIDYQNWADQTFDVSKYGTDNLESNQVIQNTIASMKDRSAAYLKQGATLPQIMAANQDGINELKAYVTNSKAANAGITGELGTMGKSESLDMEKLKKRAIRKTYFNDDGSPKSPDKISPMSVRQLMMDDPDSFVKRSEDGQINHGDLEDYIKNQKPIIKTADAFEDYQVKGTGAAKKRLEQFAVSSLVGQEIVWEKGVDGKLDPKLRFASETIADKDKDGKPIQRTMLNSESYNQYFASDGAKAALIAEAKKKYPDMDVHTAQGEHQLREVALGLLNSKAVGTSINRKEKQMDRDQTIHVHTGGDKKEANALEKERDTPVYTMMKIKQGEIDVTSQPDAKGLRRVTNLLPGTALYSNKEEMKPDKTSVKQTFSDVYIDKDKNYWVKDNPNSEPRMIKPKEEYGFMRNIAEANNMSVKNFDKFWQETHPNQNIKNLKSDLKVSQEQKSTVYKDFTEKGGDPAKFLEHYKGEHFKVTTKNGTEKWQLAGLVPKGSKYTISFVTPDGKTKELTDQTLDNIKTKYLSKPEED